MTDALADDRSLRIGWRLLIVAASVLGAWRIGPDYPATIALLGCAALLAIGDATAIAHRPRVTRISAASDAVDRETTDRYRAVLDTIGAAVFVVGPDERIVLANRAALSLAGSEIARLDDAAFLDADGVGALRAMPAGARRIVRALDGRNILVRAGGFRLPGRPEERLFALQPVGAELDAVEVEAWLAMTRVLTHEMMNALTPIVSLAESLADDAVDPARASPALRTITRRATHLLDFVERYRAFGDLPSPEPVVLDLAPLLDEIVTATRAALPRTTQLTLTLDSETTSIRADPMLIERAVVNLLSNAAKATERRVGARIEVILADAPGGARIIVADNGPGIPHDRRDEVFVPFFTTRHGGSGIGLPLARQIALQHGGSLILEEAEEGARLTLFLPGDW